MTINTLSTKHSNAKHVLQIALIAIKLRLAIFAKANFTLQATKLARNALQTANSAVMIREIAKTATTDTFSTTRGVASLAALVVYFALI